MFSMRHWLGAALVILIGATGASAQMINPWVTSDAAVSDGRAAPNMFSMAALHDSPAFKDLKPREFCMKFFDTYYDGRRKNWRSYKKGMELWAHTPQGPMAHPKVQELDPVVLMNVHGSGFCGVASGLLEGVYQSRPGGKPGKPAIDARRWFLAKYVHSVTDAYYDGKWHYLDIDLGGYAGDKQKGIWSMADVLADPDSYYGPKTTIKSKYFFKVDGKGNWVKKVNRAKSYTFQDNHMLGHEMTFALRKGETFTRYFSAAAAGWSEFAPHTKRVQQDQKGFCELIYAPSAADAKAAALSSDGDAMVFAVRCPYNITSSKVEATGTLSVSFDLGRTWQALGDDGAVAGVVNRWDYLLKVKGGALKKITTRGMLHPASLPRVGKGATKMTVTKAADYQTLTWIPDFSSDAAVRKVATVEGGLKFKKRSSLSFTGGSLAGRGSVTIPVVAPAGTRIVKVAACVIGGTGNPPDAGKYLTLHIGPAGQAKLVGQTTDCTSWGLDGIDKIDHAQNNVNGEATFDPTEKAEVRVGMHGWAYTTGLRIYVGYVPVAKAGAGTLTITHGFDGKTFKQTVAGDKADAGPVTYTVPGGATVNEFIRMEVK
jgi:hypothetical protein